MEHRYETPGALRHDARTLADDTRALLDATAEVADEKVRAARERLSHALERGKEVYGSLHDRALERAQAADDCIRDHPYQTMACAFGIGALVGILLTRRD